MFQCDCLLGFAIGSCLATAAGDGLKASQYWIQNKYFIFMLLHLSMIVRPLNIFTLWNYTGFDTLLYLDASIDGIWPALNCFGSIACGIIGFLVVRRLLLANNEMNAYTLWTVAFSLFFSIISVHYDRLVYAGGIQDYYDGKLYTVKDFFQSKLFTTFVVKVLMIMLPIQYAQIYWPREEGLLTRARKSDIIRHCAKMLLLHGLMTASLLVVLQVAMVTPSDWGWDRVIAVVVGHVIASLYLIVPVSLMSTKFVVTKRIDIRRSTKLLQKTRIRKHVHRHVEHRNGIIEDTWEENSESSVQDSEDPVMETNGGIQQQVDVNGKIE